MGDDLITNRKAHRDYEILETIEAGLELQRSEMLPEPVEQFELASLKPRGGGWRSRAGDYRGNAH